MIQQTWTVADEKSRDTQALLAHLLEPSGALVLASKLAKGRLVRGLGAGELSSPLCLILSLSRWVAHGAGHHPTPLPNLALVLAVLSEAADSQAGQETSYKVACEGECISHGH